MPVPFFCRINAILNASANRRAVNPKPGDDGQYDVQCDANHGFVFPSLGLAIAR
jgi:hypothetical protein